MIVTLTAHPSTDRTVPLAGELRRGAVQRTTTAGWSQAGGKGINISRACVSAEVPTLAVLPAEDDDPFLADLAAAGIPARPVAGAGPVRVNLTLTEPDGTTTKLNSSAEPASPGLLADLTAALRSAAQDSDWVVLAGSLPPGAPDGWYAELLGALPSTSRVALDTSEAPLSAVVAGLTSGGPAPHLMKPNGEELASFLGGDPELLESDPVQAAAAARTLVDAGVETVLATLGGHGAVLVTADGSWHATPPPTEVVSTVGAGDSSLFGYLLGERRGLAPADRLALAVAYGSAAAALPGTTIPHPAQVRPELVVVRALHAALAAPRPTHSTAADPAHDPRSVTR